MVIHIKLLYNTLLSHCYIQSSVQPFIYCISHPQSRDKCILACKSGYALSTISNPDLYTFAEPTAAGMDVYCTIMNNHSLWIHYTWIHFTKQHGKYFHRPLLFAKIQTIQACLLSFIHKNHNSGVNRKKAPSQTPIRMYGERANPSYRIPQLSSASMAVSPIRNRSGSYSFP